MDINKAFLLFEEIIEHDDYSDVVDISVAKDHNFFVTVPEIINQGRVDGLHVHNCSPEIAEQLDRAVGFAQGVGNTALGVVELAIGATQLGLELSENPAEVMERTKQIIKNSPEIAKHISKEVYEKFSNFDELDPMEQGRLAGETLSAVIGGAAVAGKLRNLATKEAASYRHVLKNQLKHEGQRGSIKLDGGSNSGLDWSRKSRRTGGDAHHHVDNNHGSLKLQKKDQGVFYGDPKNATEDAWKIAKDKGIKPISDGRADIYVIPRQNSGYSGGYSGQKSNLNHITIITEPGTNKVITSYPSGGTPNLPRGYFNE